MSTIILSLQSSDRGFLYYHTVGAGAYDGPLLGSTIFRGVEGAAPYVFNEILYINVGADIIRPTELSEIIHNLMWKDIVKKHHVIANQ